ncbi:hypothetical protein [Chryseobacterium sp. FH2]|uniref:hypothetical protein n=1 Tax=Chryseobacterium sp. FH2 TaxID=1674291 RepID=UPI00069FAB44|nr:hypothetical protein [Chryseobacterium sp. FH2]
MDHKGLFSEEIKKEIVGNWESIAVEIRPSSLKNEDGSLKPFYLKRQFKFLPEDRFELEIINFADAYGKIPLAKMLIKGNTEWQGDHPVAEGAQKVDFTADEAYEVTPLHQNFADILNNSAKDGFKTWEVGKPQNILKKKFVPFGLAEGQIFKEYDLIYLYKDMMFWGARNIDGRGFDTEENRPANLQIPLIRKK